MKRCQIVKAKGGNLKTGARRVLAVSAVVIGTSISAAWAQRTAREPSDPNSTVQPRTRQAQENPDAQPRVRQPQEDTDVPPRSREPLQEQLMIEGQRIALETIQLVVKEFGVNITMGASNISFGMPDRKYINAAFIAIAIHAGLTCPITNPLVAEINTAVLAADLAMGRDDYGMRWIKAYRQRQKAMKAT